MLMQAGGINVVPEDIIATLGHDGITGMDELCNLLAAAGAALTRNVGGDWYSQLDTGDAYGLFLIHDNDAADPDINGRWRHFIVPYRANGDGFVQCANPWGGRDIAYSIDSISAALMDATIVRWPSHASAPPPEEDMKYTPQQKNSFVRFCWTLARGQHAITQHEMDTLSSQLHDDGSNADEIALQIMGLPVQVDKDHALDHDDTGQEWFAKIRAAGEGFAPLQQEVAAFTQTGASMVEALAEWKALKDSLEKPANPAPTPAPAPSPPVRSKPWWRW